MASTEQKKKLLKAKIAVALHDELGRVPKTEEIEQVFLLSRVMCKAILGVCWLTLRSTLSPQTFFLQYATTIISVV